MTISSSNYMDLYVVQNTVCHFGATAYNCYSYRDSAGNCLRGGDNHVVKIENGQCGLDDTYDLWVWTGSNYIKNFQDADTLLTHGRAEGDNVWHATPVSGDWVHWFMT